jgi:hypothetical protein
MPRFIAIPVAQGDAFYLEREDFSVLVDGGRSRRGFPSMFKAVTQVDGVDILICTHNDADHANGVIGFLEAGLRSDEVWLPGRWLTVLPDVLKPFVDVVAKLAEEVAEDVAEMGGPSSTVEPRSGLSPLEVYAERRQAPLDGGPMSNDGPSVSDDGWPESYVQMLEQAEPWGIASWVFFCSPKDKRISLYDYYHQLGAAGIKLLWSAIDAASRIRAIAIETFHRGIPVQWFEFDTAGPKDVSKPLQPVNAREVSRVRPLVDRLLWALALTESNKESLVFWSLPTDQHPGVLFTADSDLLGINLPSKLDGALVTAPHHGSEANAKAYTAVAACSPKGSPSTTWVRSDGRFKTRPGSTYLGLSSRRLCTLCRLRAGMTTPKQAVRLFSRGRVWTRHPATATCSCQ